MKHLLTLIICAIGISISIAGREPFYYCGDKKIPLHYDSTKAAVISSAVAMDNKLTTTEVQAVRHISDAIANVTIYESSDSSHSNSMMSKVSSSGTKANVLPCYTNDNGLELAPTGYIYVELKDEADYPVLEKEAAASGCFIVRQNKFMPLWYTLHLSLDSQQNPIEVANTLYETGLFSSAEPDFSFDPIEISYDPEVHNQWGLYNSTNEGIDINVSAAWNYSTGRGIKIAIVDQGIELTHDDLKDNIYPLSYDAFTKSSPSSVYNTTSIGHGTHCAGIAAAVRNNGKMVAGVAPDATLISISCKTNGGNITEQFADGINWAWQNGADIISLSWWCEDDGKVADALDNAIENGRGGLGCIIVKSAGNNGSSITFPGDYRPEIIAVANIDSDGTRNMNTPHGSNMFVGAPGTDILSTMVGNSTAIKSGTSMACPHVAGLAALILARNPNLSASEVRSIIGKNTKKIGNLPYSITKSYGTWNEYYGYGLIDAYQAIVHTPLF